MKRFFLIAVILILFQIAFPLICRAGPVISKLDNDGIVAGANITHLSTTDSIDTAVDNATAGDSLILAAGTYTITDDIDITKSISITGQGRGLTKIVTTTDSKNCFEITASNVTIQDLTIDVTASGTKGIYVNGTGGTVLSGVLIKDIDVILNSHAGVQTAIAFVDAGGEVRDVVVIATSSNNNCMGILLQNDSTAETATTLKCYNIDVSVTAASSNVAFYSFDNSATNDCFLYLYNCTAYATGGTDYAVRAHHPDAYLYAESCVLAGDNFDAANSNSAGIVQLCNCNLVNGLTSGTISPGGHLFIPLENDATTPSLAFGGDTGFYESADGTLQVSINGTARWAITTTVIQGNQAGGPALLNETSSSINPTLTPNRSDDDTGIGLAAVDQLSMIAGGVEMLRAHEGDVGGDRLLGAGGVAIAGADNKATILPKITLQGTGVLTNGTTTTKATYMDDSPSGEWATADADMTGSDDTTYYKVGAKSLKVGIVGAASAGDVITALTTTNENWTGRESLGFWIYSDTTLSSGDFDLRITDGTQGDTDLDLPAIAADAWIWVEIDITDVTGVAVADKDDVDAISFIYTVDKTAMNVYFDFFTRWDITDETDFTQNILQDGMLSIIEQDDDAGDARTWAALTEYTDYFINYATSGNGNLVAVTDQSDNLIVMMYAYE